MPMTKRKKGLAMAGGTLAVEALFLRRHTGKLIGIRTIVRCRRGHLFTTTWIPGVSVKALRLGPWRFQRCPVGGHWSIVSPVRVAELSDADRELGRSRRDTLIP